MTEAAFNKKVQDTLASWCERMVKKFQTDMKRYGETAARQLWREDYGLVFVKQYTVPARFRHFKKLALFDLPKESRRTLDAQQKLKDKKRPVRTPAAAGANLH